MTLAVGDIHTVANVGRSIVLLSAQTATNGQPSGPTAGVALNGPAPTEYTAGLHYPGRPSREASIMLVGTTTADTPSITARLWGYSSTLAAWVPLGTGTDANKGKINAGNAIGPSSTDAHTALHSEPLLLAGHFDRLYLEITAISGTGTSVTACVVTARTVAY